jgi:hypothetical protein
MAASSGLDLSPDIPIIGIIDSDIALVRGGIDASLNIRDVPLVSRALLNANTVNCKLAFGAGINCATPYGCTDINYDKDPEIIISRPSNLVSLNTVQCQCDTFTTPRFEILRVIRSRRITPKANVLNAALTLNSFSLNTSNSVIEFKLDVNLSKIQSSTIELKPVENINAMSVKCCGPVNFDIISSAFKRTYPQFNISNAIV